MRDKQQMLISGGTLITVDNERRVIENGAVLIDQDRIKEVGLAKDLEEEYANADRISAQGKFVFPGMINTHTHLFQTLLKGPGIDQDVHKWSRKTIFPTIPHFTEKDCYTAALQGAMESIHSGCTTLVDFQYLNTKPNLTDAVIHALDETGMRAIVCRGFINHDPGFNYPEILIEPIDKVLSDCERLVSRHNKDGNLVKVGLAPLLYWTTPPEAMSEIRRFANSSGCLITIHMAETATYRKEALRLFNTSELDIMLEAGFLDSDVVAVHCTKLDDRDIRIMKDFDVKVSHNPCSNMILGSGIAPVAKMLNASLTIGLGTDGPATNNNMNMIHLLKFTALLHKVANEDPSIITAEKVLEMATIDGARAIGMENEIGSIEAGKKADLVIMSFDNAHIAPFHDPVTALVYSALGNEPDTVIINGKAIMKDRVINSIDELEIGQQAQKAVAGLVERTVLSSQKRTEWRSVGY